ncbi:MAG: hypothetical protein KKD97_16280 [Gammaproteobacteria bacterium]|nr:hypothetical protein [Gammaproteobacteria bacterium]
MRRAYEQVGDKLRARPIPSRRVARLIDGRVHTGTACKSRNDHARRWRLFWRIKARRNWKPRA